MSTQTITREMEAAQETPVEKVRLLAPEIAARAEAADAGDEFVAANYAALKQAGLAKAGVPAALGVYPVEALPPFFRFLSSWHPMHYLTDGMRSLAFYDGRAAAGLGTAVRVLALWWVLALLVGMATAWAIGRRGAPIGGKIHDRRLRTVVFGRPGMAAHLAHVFHVEHGPDVDELPPPPAP